MTTDGSSTEKVERCENCDGTGMVGYATPHYAGTAKCPDCDGTSEVVAE